MLLPQEARLRRRRRLRSLQLYQQYLYRALRRHSPTGCGLGGLLGLCLPRPRRDARSARVGIVSRDGITGVLGIPTSFGFQLLALLALAGVLEHVRAFLLPEGLQPSVRAQPPLPEGPAHAHTTPTDEPLRARHAHA